MHLDADAEWNEVRTLCGVFPFLIVLCAGGCVSTPQPTSQNGGLVPVTTRQIVRQELRAFFYFLRAKGYLLHTPMTGFPDGYWEPRELDPETMKRIPKKEAPTLDPTGELPDDIIQDLKSKQGRK